MVLPFQLYCKKCGSLIISFQSSGPVTDILRILEQEVPIDSWISNRLRRRPLRCPSCRRAIVTDPLVRSEVMFAEWDDSSGEASPPIIFYV
jgi:hypothetical protein